MRRNHSRKYLCLGLVLFVAIGAAGCSAGPPPPTTAPAAETAAPTTAEPTATPTAEPTETPETRARLVIDPNIGETPTPRPTSPGIAIPGWVAMHLPSGKLEAEVALFNPEANADWYYLTFELELADSGETIFSTGLIPPGSYCTKVELTRELTPGEYAAIMHVQPYRMNEELTPTNNADANLTLIVD